MSSGYTINHDVDLNGTLNIGNLQVASNTISSTNTNGNILFSPDGNGNVGIGVSNPVYKLHVDGDIKLTGTLYHNDDITYGSSLWSVNSSNLYYSAGNVAVGTDTPLGRLHISSGTAGDCKVFIEADTDNDNEDDNPTIIFRQDGGYNVGSIGTDHNRLILANSINPDGGISFYTGSSLATGTTNPADLGDERMFISSSGDIGVNTIDPLGTLDINGTLHLRSGTSRSFWQSNGVDSSNLTNTYISFGEADTTNDWAVLRQIGSGDAMTLALDFHDNGNDASFHIRDIKSYNTTPDIITSRVTLARGGNVGIGNSNPSYKLDVAGSINFTGDLYQNGSLFTSSGGSSQWTTSGSNIYYSTGNVAIGKSNPAEKLDIYGNLRLGGSTRSNYMSFHGVQADGYASYPHTYIGERLWAGGSDRSELLLCKLNDPQNPSLGPDRIRYASTGGHLFQTTVASITSSNETFELVADHSNWLTRMFINSDGTVGIGTTAPKAKLHITGTGNSGTLSSTSRTFLYYNSDSLTNETNSSNFSSMSLYATGEIVSSSYIISHGTTSYSDARIKENIVDINDASALDTIRLIKPRRYDYIDKLTSGSHTVWGFIAQEVKETLDYAVTMMNKSIPNVMRNASFDAQNNTITLENFDTYNLLKKSDGTLFTQLNLRTWENKEINVTIQNVVNATTLKITEILENQDLNGVVNNNNVTNTIFVYGQVVDDFHVLKKDAIFTVAVAALQEVDKRQTMDNERILELEGEVATCQETITTQNQRIATLEAQVAALLQHTGVSV